MGFGRGMVYHKLDVKSFEEMEEIGYNKAVKALEQVFPSIKCKRTEPYAHYDVIGEYKGKRIAVEIKIRNFNYPKKVIEAKKLHNLYVAANFEGFDEVYYLNIIGDKYYMYRIDNLDYRTLEYGVLVTNKCTSAKSPKVHKPVYYLRFTDLTYAGCLQ